MASRAPRPRLKADALWDYAVRQLAGRAYSSSELRKKLITRAESRSDADQTILRLKEYGYLNDKLYAESFAVSRADSKNFGKSRVLAELRSRQVAPAVAETAVSKAFAETNEVESIESFVDRKILRRESGGILRDPKELASAYRKLRRAGFTTGNILRVLKSRAKEPDIVDAFEPPPDEENTQG